MRWAYALTALSWGCTSAFAPDAGAVDAGVTVEETRDAGAGRCLPRTSLAEYDDFLHRMALAICEHQIACGEASADWAEAEDCALHDLEVRWQVGLGPRTAIASDLGLPCAPLRRVDGSAVPRCLPDLRCAPELEVCVPARATGRSCSRSWECASGCCSDGRCVESPPCGRPCDDH